MRFHRLCVLAGALGVTAGCGTGPASPHTTLVGDFSPLRAAFNADSGKVRAILLASPV